MGKARAILAPSRYLEPFGGVAVEAQLMGTPVISSDWGGFSETVEHGKTGFRCRTLSQFVDACGAVGKLDPRYIRRRAVDLYSLDRVKWMYQEYFTMLDDLWQPKGWGLITGDSDVNWLGAASARNGDEAAMEVAGRS
jgi:glycosyltransferase involved in cell wall biosynthesis